MKAIKVKNTRRKTESVQVIATELYDASDLRDWAYEHAWSGARDRLEDLDKYAGGWELLFDLIEQEAYLDGIGAVTDTYINDTIWFVDEILDDFDSVYEDTLEESKTLRESEAPNIKRLIVLVDNAEEYLINLLGSDADEFFYNHNHKGGQLETQEDYIEQLNIYLDYMSNYSDEAYKSFIHNVGLTGSEKQYFWLEESKTLRENTAELNEDYVLRIEEDYDTNTLELFLLEDEAVLAHGSDSRNTIYPWYEALVNFLSSLDTLTLDRDGVLDHEYSLTELEDEVEALGYQITGTAGYSQGDHYAVVTENGYDSGFLRDVVYNSNFYNAKILKIGRGKLIYQDSVNLFNIDGYDADMVYEVGEMLSHFSEKPAYYQIDSNIYYKDKFAEACEELGLKNFDTLEESKKIKSRVNLTEGAFDELSYNYKEDLAALYSVASFMDYMEYNDEFGTKYKSKRAYERGLYQDLLNIIEGAKASGDLSKNDVYNVDDILNANAEFIDILAGILTYFNM